MIDYYKGIDLETGVELPYLAELRGKIRQEDSASQIYTALVTIGEELDNRETLGEFTENSRALSQALPTIKRQFLSEKWKTTYDYQLVQYYLNHPTPSQVPQEEQLATEEQDMPDREALLSWPEGNTESKPMATPWWHKWLLQIVIVVALLAMMVFLDLDTSLILVVLLVMVTISLFLSN